MSDEPFDLALFRESLQTSSIGQHMILKNKTDSTMNDAVKLIDSNEAVHGTTICAEYQSQGTGRAEGRPWISGTGENILCSVLLEMEKIEPPPTRIPLASCTATTISLRSWGLKSSLKWPNDVLVGSKKISGSLVNSHKNFYILGLGVNVNQIFEPSEPEENSVESVSACSIREILGVYHRREPLLADIFNNLEKLLSLPFSDLVGRFKLYDCLVGNQVNVYPHKKEREIFQTGRAVRIDDNGFLVVDVDGEEKTLTFEEVSVRIPWKKNSIPHNTDFA